MSQYERSPELGQVLDRLREVTKKQIRVALPCSVQFYDPQTQTVNVQPLINEQEKGEDGSLVPNPFPVICHVPVAFPGAGGYRITFPIQDGDTGQVIINDLSIDEWQAGVDAPLTPQDLRRHHIADAVFYPGAHPDNKSWTGAATAALTIGKDGGPQVVVRASGVELGGTDAAPPTDAAVKGTTYRTAEDTMLTAIAAFLNAIVAGPITAPTAVLAQTAGTAINTFKAAASAYLGQTKVE